MTRSQAPHPGYQGQGPCPHGSLQWTVNSPARASSAALEACVPPVSVWARDLAPPADLDACWRLAYPRVDPAVLAPWLGSTRRSAATGR
jgi:hypothetical protein